jgi:hypothetical protein
MLPAISATHRFVGLLVAATCLLAIPLAPVAAQGDLLVAPTRLVLDGRQGGEVILSNVGAEEAVYRVTLELRRMTPDGNLEIVDESSANATEKAALEMVRYAPRRVTLPPGEPQAIRISARPGAELPDGEYRVHMSLSAVPQVRPVAPETEASVDGGLSIRIIPVYGITMPIIIRKGDLEATAGLANPRLQQDERGTTFTVDITRQGTASVYGDLLVYRQSGGDPLFIARGVGVYPEIAARESSFAISQEQAAALRSGAVRIEFRDPIASGGALLAELDAVLR